MVRLNVVLCYLIRKHCVKNHLINVKRRNYRNGCGCSDFHIWVRSSWLTPEWDWWSNCQPEVVLTYIDRTVHNDFSEVICSQALADYLDSAGEETTLVKLIYTYDFGELRGYNIEQIGSYKLEWKDEWR